MPPTLSDIQLPDRFAVSSHIANGGMAAVWAAEDCKLGRLVAIKLLGPALAEDAAAVSRFEREGRAAARLSSHPHVVTVYDVGKTGDRPFIVMEHMSGGTLADALRNGRIPRGRAMRWLEEAAGAIDAAHAQDMVHRDIKPANLLLDERGRLAVADFGIARLAFDQTVTSTGQVLGTAAYLSPEQALGETATAASDIYALAVVAFELLTGERPFRAEHFAAQARMHIEEEPPPASERDASLPPEVDAVLHRALAKDPEERWPSAEAFVKALEEALDGHNAAAAVPPTASTRIMEGDPKPAARPRPRPAGAPAGTAGPAALGATRQRRRPPVLAILAGFGALLLAALVVAAIAGSGGDDGGERAGATGDGTQARTTEPSPQAAAGDGGQGSGGSDAPGAPSGDTAALNQQGFGLMNQGNYAEAIPVLQKAVDGCPAGTQDLTCAYAMYNLGRSLRLAGRPAEAIPILERRLEIPNQTDTVQTELDAALRAAGQSGGSSEGSGGDENGRGGGKPSKDERGRGNRD